MVGSTGGVTGGLTGGVTEGVSGGSTEGVGGLTSPGDRHSMGSETEGITMFKYTVHSRAQSHGHSHLCTYSL